MDIADTLISPNVLPIRVMLADMRTPTLLHMRAMLDHTSDVVIVAEAATLLFAVSLAGQLKPHAIVTELTDSISGGGVALRTLARAAAASRVVVVSARPEEEWLLSALNAGAAGAVSARATRAEFLAALRAVAQGQIVLGHSAISILIDGARNGHSTGRAASAASRRSWARLTDRERAVFRLIAEGYSAPEAGRQLGISKKTVETYKKRIGEKLGITHRAEFVSLGLRMHVLVTPEADLEA